MANSTQTRWVVVDDTDPNFEWSGSWTLWNNSFSSYRSFGETYKGAQHRTTGGSMSFSFSGTEFWLYGTSSVISGDSGEPTPKWDCRLDDRDIAEDDPYIVAAANNWPLCGWTGRAREDGQHRLTVNATADSGVFFWVDYIRYRPSPGAKLTRPTVMIEHTDPAISYTGTWDPVRDTRNSAVVATKAGASLQLGFTGTKVTWYGWIPDQEEYPPGNSTGSYSIDGAKGVIFDVDQAEVSFTLQNQVIFETEELPPGDHTLVVTYDGPAAPLIFDYLLVEDGDPATPTGPTFQPPPSGTPSPGGGPSDSEPSDNGTGSKPPIGAIVGGVIGGIAAIGFLVVAFLVLKRRQRKITLPHIPTSPIYSQVPTHNSGGPHVPSTGAQANYYTTSPGPTAPLIPAPYSNPYASQSQQAVPPIMTDLATAQAAMIQPYYVSQTSLQGNLDVKAPPNEQRLSPLRRGQALESPQGGHAIVGDTSSTTSGGNAHQGGLAPVGHAASFYPGGVAGVVDFVQHQDSGLRLQPPRTVVSLPPVYTRD